MNNRVISAVALVVPAFGYSSQAQAQALFYRGLFKEVIKDPKKFGIYKSWAYQMEFQRPLAFPPATPKERLKTLRKALADVLKDRALLEEAKKAKLVITHVSGARTAKLVDEILSMPEDVKESLSFLVRKKGN